MATKKFLIIDSNAVIHRAFHALPPLKTSKGEIVNAIYGFCLILFKALKDIKPDFAAACFDVKGPTLKHSISDLYKAKRKKAPDELYLQIEGVKKILTALGIPVFEKQGFEADDLIGTIASQAKRKQVKPKIENIILTGDMDALQLVDSQTKVFAMRKGIKDFVLYDQGAVKEKYSGLSPAQLQDFRALRGDPSDNIPGVTGIGEKTAVNLLNQFGGLENIYKAAQKQNKMTSSPPQAAGFLSIVKEKHYTSAGVSPLQDSGDTPALAIKPSVSEKLLAYKDQAFISKQLAQINQRVEINLDLKTARFGDFNRQKAIQTLKSFEFFTLIDKIPHTGKTIFAASEEALLVQKPREKNVLQEINRLEKEGVFSKEVALLETKLIPLVKQMQKNGVRVDTKRLSRLSRRLQGELLGLEKKIYQKSGIEFNINSTQQLSDVLFKRLGVSTDKVRKTPKGALSTNARELEKLKTKHPVAGLVLKYRELFKLKTGFVDVLPLMISPETGRIHPQFHQLGTETGRMSCSEPNLQNIPVKGDLGAEIRKCFVPNEGYVFISADYSQMELRVAAAVASDKTMIELFKAKKDIHTSTASIIFGINQGDVKKEQRDIAKTVNFSVLYGAGPVSLSERAGITRQEAKEFIERYFREFSGLKNYLEAVKEQASQKGFVETRLGRKRFLQEIDSRDPRIRSQAQRMAINLPLQGYSADIMKMAMVALNERLKIIGNKDIKLILQIHDELLFEVRSGKEKEIAPQIEKIMEQVVDLGLPMDVDVRAGFSWGTLEAI